MKDHQNYNLLEFSFTSISRFWEDNAFWLLTYQISGKFRVGYFSVNDSSKLYFFHLVLFSTFQWFYVETCGRFFFNSPEPKAQVSYCHSAPSVRPSSSVNFHIFNFFSRTAWWILMKLGMHEVLMVPYKCCCISARSAKGRIQGGAKIGHGGPLLQETSSSDQKATATNRMHSNDLEACGKKSCYFWFHSEVKFVTRFWRLFGLSHFALF